MSTKQKTAFRGEAPQGLPSHLPDGERLLWQGVPDWQTMAMRVFHLRGLALYFGAIVAWCIVSGLMDSEPLTDLALTAAKVAGMGLVPIGVLALYSWGVGRSTVYSITNKRVVVQMGLVVPVTMNLPFAKVESAALRDGKSGFGDISLLLRDETRIAYLMLWPHARPWRMAQAEPTLRGIPDAAHVARILGRALAASADMPVAVMAVQERPDVGAEMPAAA